MNFQDVKTRFPAGTVLLYHSTNKNKFYATDFVLSWCDNTKTVKVLRNNGKISEYGYESIYRSSCWPNTTIILPSHPTEE